MQKGRIHSIETFGTVDGPGIRIVVFFQGCQLKCKYCHNRDTWSFNGGKEVDVNSLVKEILKYRTYIDASGGGVTASGGEATLQAEFITELFIQLKKLGIHTCLDTNGFVDIENIKKLLEYTDLVLLDIKQVNNEKSKLLTGYTSEKSMMLGRYLDEIGVPVWIRHVLVPGVTDGKDDIVEMAAYVSSLGNVERFEFLPYHNMGEHKWEESGEIYPFKNIPSASSEDIEKAKKIFTESLNYYSNENSDIDIY